jgi:hypothetical protein
VSSEKRSTGRAHRAALRGSRSRLTALGRLLHSVHEGDARSDERQQVRPIEAAPPRLRHVEELVGHQKPFVFDVRRCFQCSAGRSRNVSRTSVSFSRIVTAFGYLGPYSVTNRVTASRVCSRASVAGRGRVLKRSDELQRVLARRDVADVLVRDRVHFLDRRASGAKLFARAQMPSIDTSADPPCCS